MLSLFHINRMAVCLCDFAAGDKNMGTVRQIADNFAQNHTECKATVRCSYDYLTSHARLLQDGHANFARLSQDKCYFVQFPHCSRAAIVRFSAVVLRFPAFVRQPCNREHGYLAAFVRQIKQRVWQTMTSVIRTPCLPCSSFAAA